MVVSTPIKFTPSQALLEYINDGIVNNNKFVKELDNLVGQANEDKAWVSNMWEGISLLEDAEIRARDAEAREKEAKAREKEAKAREKEAEAKTKDAEAREKEAKAREKEAKAKTKEAEARTREAEAKTKKTEAREKGAEAQIREMEETHIKDTERNNKLTDCLLDQNRIDDLKRCTKDTEFKQQIMKELGI